MNLFTVFAASIMGTACALLAFCAALGIGIHVAYSYVKARENGDT